MRDAAKQPPSGRWLDAGELQRLVPGIASEGLTGGVLFYESHMHSSERMTLAFVTGAVARGARAANYLRVEEMMREGSRVTGIRGRDLLEDREVTLRARLATRPSDASPIFQR